MPHQEMPAHASVHAAPVPARHRPKPAHAIKCSVCPKVFKRSEHCVRHELSHTNERPFSCQFCRRTYARKDLVKRHERTIHAELYNAFGAFAGPKPKGSTTSGEESPALHARTNSDRAQDAPRDGNGNDHRTGTGTGSDDGALPVLTETTAAARAANSDANRAAPVSVADAQFSGLSLLQSPVPGSNHFNFSLPDLLVQSPFPALSASENHNHANNPDPGQPCNKRQRLSADSPSIQATHRNPPVSSVPGPSPTFLANSTEVLHPPDLLDIDLIMGDISNDFFLHHIAQQLNLSLDVNAPAAGDVLPKVLDPDPDTNANANANVDDDADASGQLFFLPPDPTATLTPAGHFSDSPSSSGNGTEKPDQIRLPMILREKSDNPPRVPVDDAAFQAFSADVSQRLGNTDVPLPSIKNRRELQHFLNGYLDCFHRHLPIVHLPTLNVAQTPSPLILAMCSIGALYRLERRKARHIYLVATAVTEKISMQYSYPYPPLVASNSIPSPEVHDSGQAVNPMPLWLLQARVLLLLHGALGNDSAIMQAEMARMGVFITEYRARRSALKTKSLQSRLEELQWHEWIEIETTKRFLCAIFICSSLLVLVYDIPPGVGITHDLDFELLEEEKLWSAASAEEWQALRASRTSSSKRTIQSVMGDMLAGKTNDNTDSSLYYVSGFTTLVIIHGLNMYAWNLSQFSHVSFSPFADLSGIASNTLTTNTLKTLARCREVLQLAQPEGIESLWNNPEGPLLLNCEAMLRVAYTRLFLSASIPEGLMLLLNKSSDNVRLLTSFVDEPQERAPAVTKVMASMCEAFSVPAKAGYLLVQKTAAINWSVEHAVAGWGCVLLLSKWLHCLDVQLDEAPLSSTELEIVSQVKTSLEGMNVDYDEKGSLAGAVVASWAPLMTDVWVWGVTTKMGAILMDLAQVYEASSKKARKHRLRL